MRTIEDYLDLPYMVVVTKEHTEERKTWVAWVVELPGCIIRAETFAEIGERIEEAIRHWIERAIEENLPIPEPKPIFA